MTPARTQMRIACGWCGIELRPGVAPTSHGICAPCAAEWLDEGLRTTGRIGRPTFGHTPPVGTDADARD